MSQVIAFRIDEDDYKKLCDVADKNGQSVSDFVRNCILSSLNKQQASVAGEVKYISNLLTALVKKVSKSDPQEADRIIENARKEE